MIRKYGIGLLATVIAVASAAFTTPKNTHVDATHVFEFTPPAMGGYSVGNVQAPGNWEYVGETSEILLCIDSPDKACRIAVTDDLLDPSDPTQLYGLTITASTSLSGKAYVTSITDEGDNVYTNRADN